MFQFARVQKALKLVSRAEVFLEIQQTVEWKIHKQEII